MKSFKVYQNCNLKDFTDSVYPQGSFCLSRLLKEKDIKVNGERVGKDIALCPGDTVVYYTSPRQEAMPSHYAVYEDENIYIADKLSGVTSEALANELGFNAVHRLDRNTQGLLVFAKTKEAEAELLAAFKERAVEKKYLALCKNNFKFNSATLEAYLVKDEKTSTVKIYDKEVKGAVKIITEFCVKERRGDLALTEITLHTGKTHQIRAHSAHIGCPVLGDEKYGNNELNKKYSAKRQRLVAASLKFNLSGKLSYLNGKTFESKRPVAD